MAKFHQSHGKIGTISVMVVIHGAHVSGISDEVPTTPSLFEALELSQHIEDFRLDITAIYELSKALNRIEPDIIFHLEAQPVVKEVLKI